MGWVKRECDLSFETCVKQNLNWKRNRGSELSGSEETIWCLYKVPCGNETGYQK